MLGELKPQGPKVRRRSLLRTVHVMGMSLDKGAEDCPGRRDLYGYPQNLKLPTVACRFPASGWME